MIEKKEKSEEEESYTVKKGEKKVECHKKRGQRGEETEWTIKNEKKE
jgi:hypothetical protein